jgi:flagellar motor switch protein FliM
MAATVKNENGAKLYDFRSSILLKPEELKSIKQVSETFAEALSLSMTGHFKRSFTAKYRETVINKFTQAVKRISMPVVTAGITIDGMEGGFFIQIDSNIMYLMVDAFLGGDSKKADGSAEVTRIEEMMLKKISERVMKHLENALPAAAKFGFDIKEVVKKAEKFGITSMDGLITMINFEVDFDGNRGCMIMGIPSFLLEPVLKKDWQSPKNTTKAPVLEFMESNAQKLKDMRVECKAVLSGMNMKLKDVVDIQVGDCVTFEHDIYKPVIVLIGGKEKYLAMPGLKGKKFAVKVTGKIKGGNNNG